MTDPRETLPDETTPPQVEDAAPATSAETDPPAATTTPDTEAPQGEADVVDAEPLGEVLEEDPQTADLPPTHDAVAAGFDFADALGPLQAELSQQASALDRLAAQVEQFHERSRDQEERLKRAQEAYQSVRREADQGKWKPLAERLAHLHTLATASAAESADTSHSTEFAFFAEAVEDVLGMLDLVSIGAAPGLPQDSRSHHAVKAALTDDEAVAGTIRRVLRQGFTFAGADRTFLPARVEVYRYSPPTTDENAASGQSATTPVD